MYLCMCEEILVGLFISNFTIHSAFESKQFVLTGGSLISCPLIGSLCGVLHILPIVRESISSIMPVSQSIYETPFLGMLDREPVSALGEIVISIEMRHFTSNYKCSLFCMLSRKRERASGSEELGRDSQIKSNRGKRRKSSYK